jgi:hypothetical protein
VLVVLVVLGIAVAVEAAHLTAQEELAGQRVQHQVMKAGVAAVAGEETEEPLMLAQLPVLAVAVVYFQAAMVALTTTAVAAAAAQEAVAAEGYRQIWAVMAGWGLYRLDIVTSQYLIFQQSLLLALQAIHLRKGLL